MDPFETLGIEASLDLDDDAFEARYLKLSRDYHPDFHVGADPAQMDEILAKSADLNRAYRTLRDRWDRARALVDRLDGEAMKRREKLDPMFLMEAMEWAEAVAECRAGASDETLEPRLSNAVEDYFSKIRAALEASDPDAAATLLHESRYARKALADLRA